MEWESVRIVAVACVSVSVNRKILRMVFDRERVCLTLEVPEYSLCCYHVLPAWCAHCPCKLHDCIYDVLVSANAPARASGDIDKATHHLFLVKTFVVVI